MFGANKSAFSATGTTGFSFGAATTAASQPFGSLPSAASTFGGFGVPATTTATPTFNFNTTTTAAPAFGTQTSTIPFGSAATNLFNPATTGTGTGTSPFGAAIFKTSATAAQGVQLAPQPTAVATAQPVQLLAGVPAIFGDEKDVILAKWNQLQACWGVGKGFYNQAGNFVEFTPQNPACKFKAIGYSSLPQMRNEDGVVALVFGRKLAEVETNRQQIITELHRLLGGRPEISVCVDSVKELPNNKTELLVYCQEREISTGVVQRVSASRLSEALCAPTLSGQLKNNLSIENVYPRVGLNSEHIQAYVANPPAGIERALWDEAVKENPYPGRLIPVPMIGFRELQYRFHHQEHQAGQHQARLTIINSDMSKLQEHQVNMSARLEQLKQKQMELSHRVLQVLAKQEVYRRRGYAIEASEEQLRIQLDAIQTELNAPMQFKGRLNELMSQIRMQSQLGGGRLEGSYTLETQLQDKIKQHLKSQHDGLQHLIKIIKEDFEDLRLIEQGLKDTNQRPR